MKKGLYIFLTLVSFSYLIGMYIAGKNSRNNVLGIEEYTATSSPSLSPSKSPSPTPTSTPTPTPTPTKTPAPKPAITPAASSEINSFIERFANQYGVDANVLRYIAICESGFRSNAKNGPYVGLYQFGVLTWKNIRAEFGEDTNPDLRYSAEESVQTAAYALSKGKSGIWPNCQP